MKGLLLVLMVALFLGLILVPTKPVTAVKQKCNNAGPSKICESSDTYAECAVNEESFVNTMCKADDAPDGPDILFENCNPKYTKSNCCLAPTLPKNTGGQVTLVRAQSDANSPEATEEKINYIKLSFNFVIVADDNTPMLFQVVVQGKKPSDINITESKTATSCDGTTQMKAGSFHLYIAVQRSVNEAFTLSILRTQDNQNEPEKMWEGIFGFEAGEDAEPLFIPPAITELVAQAGLMLVEQENNPIEFFINTQIISDNGDNSTDPSGDLEPSVLVVVVSVVSVFTVIAAVARKRQLHNWSRTFDAMEQPMSRDERNTDASYSMPMDMPSQRQSWALAADNPLASREINISPTKKSKYHTISSRLKSFILRDVLSSTKFSLRRSKAVETSHEGEDVVITTTSEEEVDVGLELDRWLGLGSGLNEEEKDRKRRERRRKRRSEKDAAAAGHTINYPRRSPTIIEEEEEDEEHEGI